MKISLSFLFLLSILLTQIKPIARYFLCCSLRAYISTSRSSLVFSSATLAKASVCVSNISSLDFVLAKSARATLRGLFLCVFTSTAFI